MGDRLVVVGGDAGGMAAATNARRGRPELEIVVLERGADTSYSACGIPGFIGGEVAQVDDLIVRTPQEFRDQFRLDVRTRHEVVGLDLARRRLKVRALDQGRTFDLPFDLLHLATGARPTRPDLPGIDGPDIYGVQTLDDARVLQARLLERRCRDVVVVGGGYIGLEMAEAFVRLGARVTLVDPAPQPMRSLDPDLGVKVAEAVRRFGIVLRLEERVVGFEPGRVLTTRGVLPADLVILGIGTTPNAELAAEAGLELGARGAIATDHRQQTSADGIYAAGDCADTHHQVSGERVYVALGTVANRTGRVAGINLGGGYARFAGVLGTALTRVCAVEIGRTGLNEREARAANLEYVVGRVTGTSRAGYQEGAEPVDAKVLVERSTGRLLGGQVVGADRSGMRVNILATAVAAGMTAAEFVDVDLGYAPAVTPLWDPFQLAARETLGRF